MVKHETERALSDALRNGGEQVIRYEDINVKELKTDMLANYSQVPIQDLNEEDIAELNSNDPLLDVEMLKQYLPSIIKGDYMSIPSGHIEDMITTLGTILNKVKSK